MTDLSDELEEPDRRAREGSGHSDDEWVASLVAQVPGKTYAIEGGEDPSVTASRDLVSRDVAEILAELQGAHPGFTERIFDDQGELRRFVNIFVADEDIRFLDGLQTSVADGQTVSIVPAVAGG